MKKSLYLKNQKAFEKTVIELNAQNRNYFSTQNELYCFIEDIKNPFLTAHRNLSYSIGSRSKGVPSYMSEKNYGPIINRLEELKLITRYAGNRRIVFMINREAVKELALTLNKK